MLFKKRWLKILTVLLAVVSFVGYFTFSTLLFPPHEGRWGFDVASLIPRDVDFFAAKADLSGDLSLIHISEPRDKRQSRMPSSA